MPGKRFTNLDPGDEEMKRPGSKNNPWKAAGLVSAIGADLIVCMVGGYYAGTYISDRTGQQGWIPAGVIAGMLLGIVGVVLLIKRFLEDSNE